MVQSATGHRKGQVFLQVGADLHPRIGVLLQICLRSRNYLFIFGVLNLDLQQYLGFVVRIILNHSSPPEVLYSQLHMTSECQSHGDTKHLLDICLVCSSKFASACEQLRWMVSCRRTGSQEQGTVEEVLLWRFCSAGVPQAQTWPWMAARSE